MQIAKSSPLIDRSLWSDPECPTIVAYGAGTDSTAMLVEMARIGWRPEVIMFADTGSEKPNTYAYLAIMDAYLAKVGFPNITIVKNRSPIAGDRSLHEECHRKSVLPSLAYGGHSCSLKWKVGPQDAKAREIFGWTRRKRGEPLPPEVDGLIPGRWNHGPWITKVIGYDAGPADARRRARAMGKWPAGYRYRYPLFEWGWDRADCVAAIERAGLPQPGKSACFMCPASKKHEVEELARDYPDLADKALTLEARAREKGLRTVAGLGRNWGWSEYLAEKGCGQNEDAGVKHVPAGICLRPDISR